MSKKIVSNIVVGGGISGLLLAYKLLKRGETVCLIEKSKNLGGLMATTYIDGNMLENYYHHIFKTDSKAIDLIKKLGLGKKLKWYKSSVSIYYNNKFWQFMGPIDLLKFRPIGLVDRLRTGLMSLYLQTTKNWHSFESVAAYKWLEKYGGRRGYEVIWKPLLKSKFGRYYKDVSMAWLWARVFLRSKSKDGGVEKLGYLNGSFGQINDKLLEKIKNLGGEVILGKEVTKIGINKGRYQVKLGEKTIDSTRLFACIANDQLAKLIDQPKITKKLKQVKYVGVINLVFMTKQNLGNYYWNNINQADSPFVALVKHSQLVGKYSGKHVYYLGAYIETDNRFFVQTDQAVQDTYFSYLKKIWPNFDSNQVDIVRVFRSSRAQQITSVNFSKKISGIKVDNKGLFLVNYSQIYPWDRGINWAIDSIDKLMESL